MTQPAPLNFTEFLSETRRDATCECGKPFEQRQLTERFMSVVEKFGAGAIQAMTRDVPDLFVPVHCPSCERRDIGRHARLHEFRRVEPRPSFGERDHAAD